MIRLADDVHSEWGKKNRGQITKEYITCLNISQIEGADV